MKNGGLRSGARKLMAFVLVTALAFPISPAAAQEAHAEAQDTMAQITKVVASSTQNSDSQSNGALESRDLAKSSSRPVYENGVIQIYSFEQLSRIGSGSIVMTLDADASAVGTGDQVLDENGNAICYAADASYRLMSNIAIPEGKSWTLPEGFAGTFVPSDEGSEEGKSTLYDETTDTIYIHNPYQLAVMVQADAADQPVLDNDADASQFGMGSPVTNSNGDVVTYSPDHSYVIAQDFSSDTPENASLLSSDETVDSQSVSANDGRDFAGQVLKEIDGKTYILIGNAEQLAAIGSGKKVYTAVYQAKHGLHWEVDKGDDGNPIMLYGGDADLKKDQNGVEDFEFGEDGIKKAEGDILEAVGRCGVNQKTGEIDPNMDIEDSGATYSADANYIIFRDIDLNDLNNNAEQSNWTPLTFSGTMVGAKASGGARLWNGTAGANDVLTNSTEIIAEDNPVISNIRVGEGEENLGVGFFGALVSKSSAADVKAEEDDHPWWDIVGGLLDGVLGLVGGLLDTLGGLVTDIVGSIAGWENISALTSEHVKVEGLTLSGVTLDTDGLYQTDASSGWSENHEMPVGAFAGQIAGDVEVVDCHVENLVSVTGASQVGGFVGKTVGSTDYLLHGTTSGLNSTLEGLGGVLDTTLDFLLPTDDLVGGLVSKLGIRNLVPTKYTPAVVQDCTVSFSESASVTGGEDYVGGFAGRVYGTKIAGCSTKGIASVEGHTNVGGFAGRIGNAYIMGLLQGLGVNLVDFPVGSEVTNCVVEGSSLKVTSTATGPAEEGGSGSSSGIVSESDDDSYVGGFAGSIMASDVVYDGTSGTFCGVKGLSSVTGGGHYVGGFAGYAGVGDVAEVLNLLSSLLNIPIKVTPNGDGTLDLGDGVTDLVDVVLGVNLNGGILSLIGLNSSKIVGCTLEGSNASISSTSGSKVGGFVGFMNGGQICEQDTEATYTRAVLEDSEGNTLYVAASSLSKDEKGNVMSTVYGRLVNGEVVLEDVHGSPLSVATTTGLPDGATAYNVYDTVYLDGKGNPATTATFKDAEWNTVYSGSGDDKVPATQAGQLAGNAYVPVYLQKTSAEGYVQFTRHYMGNDPLASESSDVALQETIYRDGAGKYYRYDESGKLVEAADVNEEQLSADALQVATQDGVVDTGSGAIMTTYIQGIASVSGVDDVGGIVGEGRLCSAADVLGNVTAVQYERFEITNVQMNTNGTELTVKATGPDSVAGGAIGYAAGGIMDRVKVSNVKSVSAVSGETPTGYAGGFVGRLVPASVAGQDNNGLDVLGVLSVNDLLGAVEAIAPECTSCEVHFADASGDQSDGANVCADVAGGFVGEMQSGTVDDSKPLATDGESGYAVYGLDSVKGLTYAGGFGGMVHSGAIAEAGDSALSDVLDIELSNLLSVVEAFVPYVEHAGVKSDGGFTVEAKQIDDIDAYSGSAGGFVGYASGAQISNCDVNALKKTDVQAPEDLESSDAPSYFDGSSSYAVTGGRYAGGFAGCVDVGSAASVGGGIKVLGSAITLTDVLSVLNTVVTTVEHSNVTGATGGFNVLASAGDSSASMFAIGGGQTSDSVEGMAGGFAGAVYGGHIQDSHVNNFEYVIGQIAAGGYVGEMEPGDVAKLLNDASVLNSLVSVGDDLASVLKTFVPTIHNSTTDCVPCGGVVRAQAKSGDGLIRGMAGGYVGHNMGGSIWGNSDASWKGEGYDGPQSPCSADRIRSVYGAEYAGGYVGLMEAADTANVGGLSVLENLIEVGNVLGALSVVYPTQECTKVTGPLENLDLNTWNAWVNYIGVHGGYGADLAQNGEFESQEKLDAALGKYVYGFNVVAGRSSYDEQVDASAGVAGGYAGLMRSGVVTDGMAYDVKDVRAMRAAGGYAGAMEVGGAANLGSVSILGLGLDLGSLLQAVEVFVPVVKGSSSVVGYSHGMKVQALGTGAAEDDKTHGCGHAGGYVGLAQGAQIWGDIEGAKGCNVNNLRMVKGANTVGGFAGTAGAGTVANANTNASDGLLQGVLDQLIKQPGDLASVLEATMTTIRGASVSPDDKAWGFVVDGSIDRNGTTEYATAAGGFVGSAEAAILGDENGKTDAGSDSTLAVTGLRAVSGGEHAGGFVGLADVGSVASVGDSGSGSADKTTLLGLIGLGNVSVLDAFRTYIYHASVSGVSDGAQVRANKAGYTGEQDSTRYLGNAGGFAGSLLNGSVKDSSVSNLLLVDAPSYAGGFAGYMGKNGTVDVDSAEVGKIYDLLGADAGILDIWGSHAERCSVSGVASGFSVSSGARADVSEDLQDAGGAQQIAGGFVGLGDLSRIADCSVASLGMVRSDQVAGGFIGQTDMAYAVDAKVDSKLLNLLLSIVNQLVKALYVDDLEKLDVIDLSGSPIANLLNLKILSDGDLVYVNLLGLKVSVALSKADASDPSGQQTDVAIITIGDSTIKLPCNENGLTGSEDDNEANLEVTLIKGNRTVVDDCTVSGIASGYDVFGGGATQDADGAALEVGQGPSQDGTYVDDAGYAGDFVGHNKEGLFEGNSMTYCDVVRGTSKLVGPFSGKTDLKSTYEYFNQVSSIEGKDQEGAFNTYSIYRSFDASLTAAKTADEIQFATATEDKDAGVDYNRFTVNHYGDKAEGSMGISSYEQLKDAVMSGASGETTPLDAYISPAKAVLMGDASYSAPSGGITPEPGEGQDPCNTNAQITLQKVWNDGGNSQNTRPESVTFVLKRSYTNANGQQVTDETFDTDGKMEVALTAADDASDWSNTWRKVVSDLPVTFEDKSVSPAKTRYYTYYVEEISYGEYSSDVSYSYTVSKDDTGYVVTVTNSLPLPETGGSGESPYLWLAVLLLLLGIAWYVYRQRKETTSATCSPYSTGRTVKRSGRTWRGLFGRAHKGLHARRR